MAALAAKAMGAVPVKEKQALLEIRRQQSKKAKAVLVGSSSKSVIPELAVESRYLDVECVDTSFDADTKEEIPKRPDGVMEKGFGRLALQASPTIGKIGGETSAETAVGIDEIFHSKFCIRQYTEIVRQDRGDLKQSWPLAEEYLRGHIFQGRVQVSLWPPICAGESNFSQPCGSPFHVPDVSLPHLFKLETAFAESGLSEDKAEQSRLLAEEVKNDSRLGSQVTSSLDLQERRPSEEGTCVTRTKSVKVGRRISPATESFGDGDVEERPKSQDRPIRDLEARAKYLEQSSTSKAGTLRAGSRFENQTSRLELEEHEAGLIASVVEHRVKPLHGDFTLIQSNEIAFPRTEPGANIDTCNVKQSVETTRVHVLQDKKSLDRLSKVQVLAEKVAEIGGKVVVGVKGEAASKGKAASNTGGEVEAAPASRPIAHVGDLDTNSKRGEREVGELITVEKETVVSKRHRNEDDRVLEERFPKSDAAASRLSTKRQSNKACPVCRSFSSMSQTTMNVHIDSCLVEHRQEEHEEEADLAESEPEPCRDRELSRSKVPKSKGQGGKPKRKKRSIADIVANSVTRTLDESPGVEGGPGVYRLTDQVHDPKNLNWVSGNKKKRQPRNVPSRSLNEENDSKRRRISRVDSANGESKPGKQEKRRLPVKEREGGSKQSRVERSTGHYVIPQCLISRSSKVPAIVQDGAEVDSRRSGARKAGVATPRSQSPNTRPGSGRAYGKGGGNIHASKVLMETEFPESTEISRIRISRTSAEENVAMEVAETLAQNIDNLASGKSSNTVEETPTAAAKPRAHKAHWNPATPGRLGSSVSSTERAPKTPWYPPAAMLRGGTMPPIVVAETAAATSFSAISSGSMKSPGSTDTIRMTNSAETSILARKSPRSSTVTAIKGQKGSGLAKSLPPGSLPSSEALESNTNSGEPSSKSGTQVETKGMAECTISKEVDDYLDQTETRLEAGSKVNFESKVYSGHDCRAVSVKSQHISTDLDPEVSPGRGSISEVLGKSHGDQRKLDHPIPSDGVQIEEGSGVSFPPVTTAAVSSLLDGLKVDLDHSPRELPEGSTAGACSDNQTLSLEVTTSIQPNKLRRRNRGESKAKSKVSSEELKGKGKTAPVECPGEVDDCSSKQSIPCADSNKETSGEENQRRAGEVEKVQAGITPREQNLNSSADQVQIAFQDMVVRRVEGMVGQEGRSDHLSVKTMGERKGDDLVTLDNGGLELAPLEIEKLKEGVPTTPAQVDSAHKLQTPRQGEILNNVVQLRFGKDSGISTSTSQTGEAGLQAEDCGATAQSAVENVPANESPQPWPLVPLRPAGRKKLPIKCAARNVGSANVVALASKQGTGSCRKNNTGPRLATSIECLGPEEIEKSNSSVVISAANDQISPLSTPKPPVGRSRAARQLAKSVPGGKKCAPHVEASSPESGSAGPADVHTESNAKEMSNSVGYTPIASAQQALLSPSSSWVNNSVRRQPTLITTSPGRVPSATLSPWDRASGLSSRSEVPTERISIEKCNAAPEKSLGDELHCTETLFSSPAGNTDASAHERVSREATFVSCVENCSSIADMAKRAESGMKEKDLDESEADASRYGVAVSQQLEGSFSTRKSPDQSCLGKTASESEPSKRAEQSSTYSATSYPELPSSAACSPAAQKSSRTGVASVEMLSMAGHGKPRTAAASQPLEAGLLTIGLETTDARLAAVVPKIAPSTTGLNPQSAPVGHSNSNSATGSTRVASYRLDTSTTDAGSFQGAGARPVMLTTSTILTSFTSLLQSTTLPPQSSAALTLAMQGTRPLQEAGADQKELSRATPARSSLVLPTDMSKRSPDVWVSEKQALPTCNDTSSSIHAPVGPAFFRPPPEMSGPNKASESGDKEISRLPSWMRAAISDPKSSDSGNLVNSETDHTSTEVAKALAIVPESGEMSGSVRVRLWGRDVVVPPNEQNTEDTTSSQQCTFGHRSETPRAVETFSETITSCLTSTACSEGPPVNSHPAPVRVGQDLAENGHQSSMPANNLVGVVVGSTERLSTKQNNQQAENYLSRLDFNNQRTSYSANSSEELRSMRASKAHSSGAALGVQATTPPEVIIIDDSAESPAKSVDSFPGESLTMAFLLDCGALRYLPSTQNGRSGSQLMEVDPSKIPQRLVNHNFNILAELRKIGLVPAPKAVLPASYRYQPHSLSLEVPHSTPAPASRAGSDVLPPWLLAEKKRKEAQIAENLIVLDDDDEPATGTVILGERRPLHSLQSSGGGSNLSGQSQTGCPVSPPTIVAKSANETRSVEPLTSTATLRPTVMSQGATTIPGSGQNPTSLHAAVHSRRGTGSPFHTGVDNGLSPGGQKGTLRKTGPTPVDLVRTAAGKESTHTTSVSEHNMCEKSEVQLSALKEQPAARQTASGSSPAPRRHREENKTEKERPLQVSDVHLEKKTSKAGMGNNKLGSLSTAVGQAGLPAKKGSTQGISILAPTWMSGNNGCLKRGAAAQACKQAVERLKAQILSSPARDGSAQAGPGGVLDFESHMIGQAQDKSTSFGGNLLAATSGMQNISTQPTLGGFRYSSLSSRSGGDHESANNGFSSKDAPHNGRAVGQSPTPVTFTSSLVAVAVERDVSTMSKSLSVASLENTNLRGNQVGHNTGGPQRGMPSVGTNHGQNNSQRGKSSGTTGAVLTEGKMSNLMGQNTSVRDPSPSEHSSPVFPHLGRSTSSSPTLRSRGVGGPNTVNETTSTVLSRGMVQPEQGSSQPAQATNFSRLPPSRLSLPLAGTPMATPTTKTLLEQVCFTSKAAAESFTREVANFHVTLEQSTGRMASPQKRIQPSRRKGVPPVNSGEKVTTTTVSGSPPGLTPANIITSSSNTPSRPSSVFLSSGSPPTTKTTSDQRRQVELGALGMVSMTEGEPGLGKSNGPTTGSTRTSPADLPLSPVFGRISQSSSPSPNSSQRSISSSNATLDNLCEGGKWSRSGAPGADGQAPGLPDHSPSSGVISGYRLPPQVCRAMGGHSPRPRGGNISTLITEGGFFGQRGNLEQFYKDSEGSPRSRGTESPSISANERFSQSRITREEKLKEAQRESPKLAPADSAEKIRTKSLNSI